MPRCARVKSYDSVYHVMVRSVGDTQLFKTEDDKYFYLRLFKKYKETFLFKVYAYCLMDTHAHFIIDCNGSDISKFMHVINQCYAQYYNKRYNRHGHLFADRFKSKIIKNDKYLLVLSGYIHNNPHDIEKYENCVELYPFSSLGYYLGISNDIYKILDIGFIINQFSNNLNLARNLYMKFVSKCSDIDFEAEAEFSNEISEYRSERSILIRNYTFEQITNFISKYTGDPISNLHIKFIHRTRDFRAICILVLHSLCNLSYKQICEKTGNLTISQLSKLSSVGFNLINNNPSYKNIVNDLIKYHTYDVS